MSIERTPIVEVEATTIDINQIRLKFHGLPGDTGPDLIMDEMMARTVIQKLSATLPENLVRPKIICLCGSTRFLTQYMRVQAEETYKGNIVLTVGCFVRTGDEGISMAKDFLPSDKQKSALDQLHLRKIDMADEIYIINPSGYLGDSTKAEVLYARKLGKVINSMEPLSI